MRKLPGKTGIFYRSINFSRTLQEVLDVADNCVHIDVEFCGKAEARRQAEHIFAVLYIRITPCRNFQSVRHILLRQAVFRSCAQDQIAQITFKRRFIQSSHLLLLKFRQNFNKKYRREQTGIGKIRNQRFITIFLKHLQACGNTAKRHMRINTQYRLYNL